MDSGYFKNCLKAIRQTVYGRDNRKPIADAIEKVDTANRHHIEQYAKYALEEAKEKRDSAIAECNEMISLFPQINDKLGRALGSVVPDPYETWYTYDYVNVNFEDIAGSPADQKAIVETGDLSAELIADDEYFLVDALSGDDVSLIMDDDYQLNVVNPIAHTYVHHGDDYKLVISRINGH